MFQKDIFSKSVGNKMKLVVYPVKDDPQKALLRVELWYLPLDINIADNYRYSEDPSLLVNYLRKMYKLRYSLRLRDKTMERVEKSLREGSEFFAK